MAALSYASPACFWKSSKLAALICSTKSSAKANDRILNSHPIMGNMMRAHRESSEQQTEYLGPQKINDAMAAQKWLRLWGEWKG